MPSIDVTQSLAQNFDSSKPSPNETEDSLQSLIRLVEHKIMANNPINGHQFLLDIMKRVELREKDWKPYAHFDPYTYTRNLIHQAPNFHWILLCWGPNQCRY